MVKKASRFGQALMTLKQSVKGVYDTYTTEALRYSQNAPLTMYKEVNTRCNLPAQIDIEAVEGMEYNFLCVVKGGGSANKSYLFQKTKAILNPDALIPFLMQQIKDLGTAACPPYHIAIVIGGTSAEKTMLTVKLLLLLTSMTLFRQQATKPAELSEILN